MGVFSSYSFFFFFRQAFLSTLEFTDGSQEQVFLLFIWFLEVEFTRLEQQEHFCLLCLLTGPSLAFYMGTGEMN